MDIFDQKTVLASMVVLHDCKEQDTDRARRRYSAFGYPHARAIIDYGDYTYNATLPNGEMIFDTSQRIFPKCVIERKMNLEELSQCFAQGRKRFEKEFLRAESNGARIYLLIEDANWEMLINGCYDTRFCSKAFTNTLISWSVRYNMVPIMCKKETTPRLIGEILYRDLKERLERGEFDARLDNAPAENNGSLDLAGSGSVQSVDMDAAESKP